MHLLHPLTAENEERPRLASFLSDSAASETSCEVTLRAEEKCANGKRQVFWGARAADLKSHPSVLRLTIWTSEITWARACQAGSTAEILAGPTSKGKAHEIGLLEDCVQEKKTDPYVSHISQLLCLLK